MPRHIPGTRTLTDQGIKGIQLRELLKDALMDGDQGSDTFTWYAGDGLRRIVYGDYGPFRVEFVVTEDRRQEVQEDDRGHTEAVCLGQLSYLLLASGGTLKDPAVFDLAYPQDTADLEDLAYQIDATIRSYWERYNNAPSGE